MLPKGRDGSTPAPTPASISNDRPSLWPFEALNDHSGRTLQPRVELIETALGGAPHALQSSVAFAISHEVRAGSSGEPLMTVNSTGGSPGSSAASARPRLKRFFGRSPGEKSRCMKILFSLIPPAQLEARAMKGLIDRARRTGDLDVAFVSLKQA